MLPTREEAKEDVNIMNCKYPVEPERVEKAMEDIKKVVEAYSSGSLIEAKTEGEIEKIINATINKIGIELKIWRGNHFSKYGLSEEERIRTLSHALVGKV